jgi:uncharacterized protein YdhG (YjbR/CyaY superfamily)
MKTKPRTIDEYLAGVSDDQRTALEKLRKTIKSAAPKAEECISYSIPAFRLNGILVGFAAKQSHCALYPFNGTTVKAFKKDLEGYETSMGTIRFQPDSPLPAALVRKIVKARMAQNEAAPKGPPSQRFG